ncbi:MAG: hypothetical protein Q9219_001868 [cf. Caloplaca sp. 3 TL-2023]
MNEGAINVLGQFFIQKAVSGLLRFAEHYFEMSKYDAERALKIYKTFSRQTDQVVQYLSVARQYENATRLEIPKLKHAPTSLTSSLEEYLNDPDFEINRRQYLAQQDAKKGKKPTADTSTKSTFDTKKSLSNKDLPKPKATAAVPAVAAKPLESKAPAPDLIDFFDSIEQNQQPMAVQSQQIPPATSGLQFSQQPQSSAFSPQSGAPLAPNGQSQQPQMNGFNPMNNSFGQSTNQVQQTGQPDYTGAGLGGYSQQSFGQQPTQAPFLPPITSSEMFPTQQQQSFNTNQQTFGVGSQSPQSTNPFRQASMPTGASTSSFANSPSVSSPINRQATNPFARSTPSVATDQSQSSPFASAPPQQQPSQPFPQNPPQPIQPHKTGINPFARNITPQSSQTSTPPPLVPSMTGSTNPFRQSTMGWQSNQGTLGGLEQMPTVPVFPRLGQPQQSQSQQQPWP